MLTRHPTDNATAGASAHPAVLAALVAVLAACGTFIVTLPERTPVTLAVPETVTPVVVTAPREVQRAVFFDAEVAPQIDVADRLNREAAERCLARLGNVFDRYRAGVEPFVEDLTSLSTRFGIVRRMPGNWWNDDKRIETYVRNKFETHLFTQEQLFDDVARVLERFRDEVNANQKTLLVHVQASLDTADLPEVRIDQYEPFFQAVAARLRGYSAEQGTASVYNALTVLLISEAGSYAAVTIVAGLVARFGTAAAVTAATGAGATAGATAAGAGGGSLVGPVGTAVGLGVGLAVGLIIDWWMTDRFEAEMTIQMTAYLSSLEETILKGSVEPSSQATSLGSLDSPTGLADGLPRLCDRLADAYRMRFFEQIVTVEPSK